MCSGLRCAQTYEAGEGVLRCAQTNEAGEERKQMYPVDAMNFIFLCPESYVFSLGTLISHGGTP